MVSLFPKLDFGQLAVEPAVADDAVLRRCFAGEIIRLRGAGDGGECGCDVRQRAALAEGCDARRVFAYQRLGETDHIDDSEPVHKGFLTTDGHGLTQMPSRQTNEPAMLAPSNPCLSVSIRG